MGNVQIMFVNVHIEQPLSGSWKGIPGICPCKQMVMLVTGLMPKCIQQAMHSNSKSLGPRTRILGVVILDMKGELVMLTMIFTIQQVRRQVDSKSTQMEVLSGNSGARVWIENHPTEAG